MVWLDRDSNPQYTVLEVRTITIIPPLRFSRWYKHMFYKDVIFGTSCFMQIRWHTDIESLVLHVHKHINICNLSYTIFLCLFSNFKQFHLSTYFPGSYEFRPIYTCNSDLVMSVGLCTHVDTFSLYIFFFYKKSPIEHHFNVFVVFFYHESCSS